jgi:hypothetical protein
MRLAFAGSRWGYWRPSDRPDPLTKTAMCCSESDRFDDRVGPIYLKIIGRLAEALRNIQSSYFAHFRTYGRTPRLVFRVHALAAVFRLPRAS